MQSRDLIRENLERSRDLVLAKVEDMRAHATVFPTPNGGAHTLWVLGHLAFIEGLVVDVFARGGENPLAAWEPVFDGPEPRDDPSAYPPFDEVLERCREQRAATLALLDTLAEDDLDAPAPGAPDGWEATFGTVRRCLQFVADHGLMHRGQLADARRAARVDRMWAGTRSPSRRCWSSCSRAVTRHPRRGTSSSDRSWGPGRGGARTRRAGAHDSIRSARREVRRV